MLSQDIPCNHGVLEDQIAEFEHHHKVRIPADLRHYFMTMNGTAGDYAYGAIRFWDLDEFKSVAEKKGNTRPNSSVILTAYHELFNGAECYFIFADFLYDMQLYAIHLSSCENVEANQIIMLDGSAPIEVADTFSAFVDTYIESPERLRLLID